MLLFFINSMKMIFASYVPGMVEPGRLR